MHWSKIVSIYKLSLHKKVNIKGHYLWSDNEAALCWITYDRSKCTYVKNRVNEINEISDKFIFSYVPTKENPADLLSRGVSTKTILNNKLWIHGPEWLGEKNKWPEQKIPYSPSEKEDEVSDICSVAVENPPEPLIDVHRFSSLSRLIGTTKRILNFKLKWKCKRTNTIFRSVTDSDVYKFWIKETQNQYFNLEMTYLLNPNSASTVPKRVKSLRLFLAEELIRCQGRIDHANLPYNTKYPILLSSKSWFTKLLILSIHEDISHAGVQDVLCKVREQYWIIKGRQTIKKALSSCMICKKSEGAAFKLPPSPPLPKFRVEDLRPFEVCGVDYTGAILIKNCNDEIEKHYIALFTCATTRAVHLEVAKDGTAHTFLNIFRRFSARRSYPKLMISDNASNFKLSSDLLKQIFREEEVHKHLERVGCQWQFIPPKSPWHGGFWERLISIAKSSLRKVLYRKQVNSDDFNTIVTEIECRMNNRPLSYVISDLDNPEPLTPSHLLQGRRINPLPSHIHEDYVIDPDFLDDKIANEKYEKCSSIINEWFKVWKGEYLTSLRERQMNSSNLSISTKIKINDVVQIKSDGPRSTWNLGRVIQVYPGEDGHIRVVKLKTANGEFIRTVAKLYPLELSENTEESVDDNDLVEDSESSDSCRPVRQCAKKAKQLIRKLLTDDDS